ncbi:MAG: hypothetical protein ABJN65_02570 [Parasphingorhabdus sp.]
MSRFRSFIACAILFCSFPLFAEQSDLSNADKAAMQFAHDRGVDIYRYDQAAWHSTDALKEDITDLNNSGIVGWVTTKAENGLKTTYWRPDKEGYRGVYSAIWTGTKTVDRRVLTDANNELSREQKQMIEAFKLIDLNKIERCKSSPFNLVTLPPDEQNGPITVYLLTPQTENKKYPLGGHYRFEVQNGKVKNQRKFMNSCFDMNLEQQKDNITPEIFFVTHSLDPFPTEIHVFSAISARIPIGVITIDNEYIWVIDGSNGEPKISRHDQP